MVEAIAHPPASSGNTGQPSSIQDPSEQSETATLNMSQQTSSQHHRQNPHEAMFEQMRQSNSFKEPAFQKIDSIQLEKGRKQKKKSIIDTGDSNLPESVQGANKLGAQILREIPPEESKSGTVLYGGMTKHERPRIDRLGKNIKSKRERQPNGQKKRLAHKVTFCDDEFQADHVRQPLEEVIMVESYKKYNMDSTYNDQGCCVIF